MPFNEVIRVPVAGQVLTAGASLIANIDRKNPDGSLASWMTIDVIATAPNAVTNKPTALNLQHTESTSAPSFDPMPGFFGGAIDGFTIPNAVTSGLNVYKFNVNCRGRKRYISVQYIPSTTQTLTIVANMDGGNNGGATTAAKANVLALVEG